MTLEWIIERLKVSGEGSKQEVLNALENASADDLKELAFSCLAKTINPLIEALTDFIKNLDADTIKELLQKEEPNGECS